MKFLSRFYSLILLSGVLIGAFVIFEDGYGVEEDSLTAAYTAYEIYSTGEYHISRLPGHPIFEYALGITWPLRSLMWPLFMALGLFLTGIFGRKIMQAYGVSNEKSSTFLLLLLTPVMIFTLGETMEYSLALGTLAASWYFALRNHYLGAAIWLALSTGLRLPNLIFGLPLFILIFQKQSGFKALCFAALTFTLSAISYIPAYQLLGAAFFDTYQLPYPSLLKILYKGSVGTWGILGSIGIILLSTTLNWKELQASLTSKAIPVLLALFFAAMLYIMLPEKSAFLLPFVVIIGGIVIRFSAGTLQKLGFLLLLLNPIFLGTELVDKYRGIPEEKADIQFEAGGQTMGIQFFLPHPAEKMKNKDGTVNLILTELEKIEKEAFVVTGWWYPFLQVSQIESPMDGPYENIEFVYYADENQILSAMREGKSIFFTPEAEIFNVQRYGHDLLERYGKPLITPAN